MSIEKQYQERQYCRERVLLGILLVTLIVSLVTLTANTNVSGLDLLKALYYYAKGALAEIDNVESYAVILILRLPRLFICLGCGAVLGIAGFVMQSITKNDLVSPFTTGISAAAAFGASVAVVLGISKYGGTVGMAFLMCGVCLIVLLFVVSAVGTSPTKLALAGIALNYLFAAAAEGVRFFARGRELEAIVQWSFGSLNRANWDIIFLPLLIGFCCINFLGYYMSELQIIANNSEDVANGLGVSVKKVSVYTGGIATLMTAAMISVTGVIGFVGLVAPHMARVFFKGSNEYAFYGSGCLGSFLVVFADFLGRIIIPPSEIPAGVIISFIGAPLFIHMLIKEKW